MRVPCLRPAAAAFAFALMTASPLLAATPAAAAPADLCGGQLADYVGPGPAVVDTAFTGTVDDGGTPATFTLTPRNTAGVVRAEIIPANVTPGTLTVVESSATVGQDYAGNGAIVFDTPRGSAASDTAVCSTHGAPTRVNSITGTILVGMDHLESFVLKRK